MLVCPNSSSRCSTNIYVGDRSLVPESSPFIRENAASEKLPSLLAAISGRTPPVWATRLIPRELPHSVLFFLCSTLIVTFFYSCSTLPDVQVVAMMLWKWCRISEGSPTNPSSTVLTGSPSRLIALPFVIALCVSYALSRRGESRRDLALTFAMILTMINISIVTGVGFSKLEKHRSNSSQNGPLCRSTSLPRPRRSGSFPSPRPLI